MNEIANENLIKYTLQFILYLISKFVRYGEFVQSHSMISLIWYHQTMMVNILCDVIHLVTKWCLGSLLLIHTYGHLQILLLSPWPCLYHLLDWKLSTRPFITKVKGSQTPSAHSCEPFKFFMVLIDASTCMFVGLFQKLVFYQRAMFFWQVY